MATDKFALLANNIDDIQEGAPLKETTPIKKKKNQMIYGLSVELAKAVEANGESLSGFAKRAMMKVAKAEGII